MAHVIHLVSLMLLFAVAHTAPPSHEDYDDDSDEIILPACDSTNCMLPNCSCFNTPPPVELNLRPQFVMLTFDDAITVANIDTYRKIARNRRNRNGQNMQMTFFVCHEYNDYALTNEMYKQGHEIAVHSVSHESNTDLWRDATVDKWRHEMNGMRTMLTTFGGIPPSEVLGHRAPFLQTAGNITFETLQNEGFLYDSSMPSRSYMDPPVWPYTFDFGYLQDCQIEPCPTGSYPGVWEVPMIQYRRNSVEGVFYCSMLDACTPYPKTALDTKEYLKENFLRHYKSTKAPFPIFLHEAWLRDEHRLNGFIDFLDEILTKEDVFVVSIRQVIEYMKKPVSFKEFRSRQQPPPDSCNAEVCSYKNPLRIMKSCRPCSKYYPWVGTPLGRRPPKDFPL